MADMLELIARLESAEVGSVELDYLIDEAFSEWRNIGGGFAVHKVTGERRRNSFDCSAPVTTAIDAALALAERVLPGWGFYLRTDKDGHGVGLTYPEYSRVTPGHVEHKGSLPLALCIAILKAKAQGEGG